MSTKPALQCPFCHAAIGARDAVCRQCRAEKRTRAGMSPSGFRWYFSLWVMLVVPVMFAALWLAAVPWTPSGEPPGYAMAIIGARPAQPAPRCVMQVLDASGRMTEVVTDGACGGTATAAPRKAEDSMPRGQDKSTLRMAAAVHSTLALATGLLVSWLLLRAMRKPFLRRIEPSWVRRATA